MFTFRADTLTCFPSPGIFSVSPLKKIPNEKVAEDATTGKERRLFGWAVIVKEPVGWAYLVASPSRVSASSWCRVVTPLPRSTKVQLAERSRTNRGRL